MKKEECLYQKKKQKVFKQIFLDLSFITITSRSSKSHPFLIQLVLLQMET